MQRVKEDYPTLEKEIEAYQFMKGDIAIKDRRYVSYWDESHEGGEAVEIHDFDKLVNGYGYDTTELIQILSMDRGGIIHLLSHPMISMGHYYLMRVK